VCGASAASEETPRSLGVGRKEPEAVVHVPLELLEAIYKIGCFFFQKSMNFRWNTDS
jgi:hypothetical protein